MYNDDGYFIFEQPYWLDMIKTSRIIKFTMNILLILH